MLEILQDLKFKQQNPKQLFSEFETVFDIKNRILGIDGVQIANLDAAVVKNLATGKCLRDSMLCKGTNTIVCKKLLLFVQFEMTILI